MEGKPDLTLGLTPTPALPSSLPASFSPSVPPPSPSPLPCRMNPRWQFDHSFTLTNGTSTLPIAAVGAARLAANRCVSHARQRPLPHLLSLTDGNYEQLDHIHSDTNFYKMLMLDGARETSPTLVLV